jgi:hypothetical protein
MNCETKPVSTKISQSEAIALYNAIDLQLLKEASISKTDAQAIVKRMPPPLVLPTTEALNLLTEINNPEFASMLLYSFIPSGVKELKENPVVEEKRNEQIAIVDFIAKKSGVEVDYIQKHLRNVLVDGYGQSPENLLHDIASKKENQLGWITAAIGAAAAIVPLFSSGAPEDRSTVGYQNFLNSANRGKIFPSIEEMLMAARSANWDSGNEARAIENSYDEQDGTWQRGDWHFAVTSLTPIKARQFKGASETFQIKSNVNSQAIERAYARQTGPSSTDWQKKISGNVTNDPAYQEKTWYKNPWIIGGIVIGTGVVSYGGYTLLSDK